MDVPRTYGVRKEVEGSVRMDNKSVREGGREKVKREKN